MNLKSYFALLLVMAVVTYLVRAVPFVVFRKKIENKFFKSFLAYVPYAVLGAMTFPAIFTSTGSVISATIGCAVAIFLAFPHLYQQYALEVVLPY